jgi:hypothetical protein
VTGQVGKRMPCRRFTLLDALILVAGAAVGFAGCRASWDRYSDWDFQVQMFVNFFLMLASWLVLIFRLRRPRPSIRQVARQPGTVACFAVVALQIVQSADTLFNDLIIGDFSGYSGVGPVIWTLLSEFDPTSAAVVPISWVILIANRRRRPEPGWIDRSGRLLGWIWIAWIFVWPLFYWFVNYHDLTSPRRSIM